MSQKDVLETDAFVELFKAVCFKCFAQPLEKQLTEPESRHLSLEIEEKTGLVIGWKSLKNYSGFALETAPIKRVNPSPATLDTLSRYYLEAPPISEQQRKRAEIAFNYWFKYREKFLGHKVEEHVFVKKTRINLFLPIAATLLLLTLVLFFLFNQGSNLEIEENFDAVDEVHLSEHGWMILSKEATYWERRGQTPGQLTLFTLEGDSWRSQNALPEIQNLVVRKAIDGDFSTEIHFQDFIPSENWQQAGILLMEDTTFLGKSIRISIAFNDYFGGYDLPGEIIIQAVASYGKSYQNVEEIAHQTIFKLDKNMDSVILKKNLTYSALRIEKRRHTYRFLYSCSPLENFSFKELTNYELEMTPKFVAIFAIKGFVDSTTVVPVSVDFFRHEQITQY